MTKFLHLTSPRFNNATVATALGINVSDTVNTSENIVLNLPVGTLSIDVEPANSAYFINGVKIVGP